MMDAQWRSCGCWGYDGATVIVEAIGAAVLEMVDSRIKEIRDYRKRASAAAVDSYRARIPVGQARDGGGW